MQDPGAWPGAEAVPREIVSHMELQGKNHPAHPPGPGWDTEDRGSSDTDHGVNLAAGGGWGWLGGQGRTRCTPSPHSPSQRLKGPQHLVTGILQNGFTASLHSQPVLFSCSVVSDSLRSHGLQHTRLPCPSPSHRVCSNSCHPTILSTVTIFSSCPKSIPESGSFPVHQLFASCGQSIPGALSPLLA